jgi:hypothetical protein
MAKYAIFNSRPIGPRFHSHAVGLSSDNPFSPLSNCYFAFGIACGRRICFNFKELSVYVHRDASACFYLNPDGPDLHPRVPARQCQANVGTWSGQRFVNP